MEIKKIIEEIKEKQPNVKSVFFVGCGASQSDLYPGKYFLEGSAKELRSSVYTANEFNYATPVSVNEYAIVITCSLGGNTPETVKATALAKSLGAHVIAVTHAPESPITENADYVILHGFEGSDAAKIEKMTNVLALAVEILNQYEGYEHYGKMADGLSKIYGLVDKAAASAVSEAKAFADAYMDAPVIYVMSSGATHMVAYSFSICLMMEMQWINSGSFHDGEFFHGPFEIVDKEVPFLLLMNDGKTRAMDSRALTFLRRFEAKVTVVDAKDFGLGSEIAKEVVDYFNPILISGVIRVYAEQLAIMRNHPLSKRRYMWKLEY